MSAFDSVDIASSQYDDPGVDLADQREHERIQLPWDLEITRSDGERLKATMNDISEGGAGLQHAIPLNVGEVVSGNIQGWPHSTGEFHILVKWCKPDGAGFFRSGGHFVDLAQWYRRCHEVPSAAS